MNAIKFPILKDNERHFLKKLIYEFGNPNSKPVLFSQNDSYTVFISRNRNILKQYFRFNIPTENIIELVTSKEKSSYYARKCGLKIPKTYTIKRVKEINDLLKEIELPCIVKPKDSYSSLYKRKAYIINSYPDLVEFFNINQYLYNQIVIQQFIPGGDENIYQATAYLSKKGRISTIFTMRKIRQYYPSIGTTSYGISEDVPEIRELLKFFVNSLNEYQGFISVEFKKNSISGDWYYIETNPRLPYYHSMILGSQINFPYMYFLDMLGVNDDEKFRIKQKYGLRWIYFLSDFQAFMIKRVRRQIFFPQWAKDVFHSRSFAFFDKKDLLPFLYINYVYYKNLVKRSLKN